MYKYILCIYIYIYIYVCIFISILAQTATNILFVHKQAQYVYLHYSLYLLLQGDIENASQPAGFRLPLFCLPRANDWAPPRQRAAEENAEISKGMPAKQWPSQDGVIQYNTTRTWLQTSGSSTKPTRLEAPDLHFGQWHFVIAEQHFRWSRQALRPCWMNQEELQNRVQHAFIAVHLHQEAWSVGGGVKSQWYPGGPRKYVAWNLADVYPPQRW